MGSHLSASSLSASEREEDDRLGLQVHEGTTADKSDHDVEVLYMPVLVSMHVFVRMSVHMSMHMPAARLCTCL